jgi:hypothetical protein
MIECTEHQRHRLRPHWRRLSRPSSIDTTMSMLAKEGRSRSFRWPATSCTALPQEARARLNPSIAVATRRHRRGSPSSSRVFRAGPAEMPPSGVASKSSMWTPKCPTEIEGTTTLEHMWIVQFVRGPVHFVRVHGRQEPVETRVVRGEWRGPAGTRTMPLKW